MGRGWRVPIRVWRRRTGQLHPQCRNHLGIAWGGADFRAGYILHGADQHRQPSPFALAGSPTSDLLNHHRFPGPVAPATPPKPTLVLAIPFPTPYLKRNPPDV